MPGEGSPLPRRDPRSGAGRQSLAASRPRAAAGPGRAEPGRARSPRAFRAAPRPAARQPPGRAEPGLLVHRNVGMRGERRALPRAWPELAAPRWGRNGRDGIGDVSEAPHGSSAFLGKLKGKVRFDSIVLFHNRLSLLIL